MTPPEAPSGAASADDPLHAEWLRLGAAFAAFDRSVRDEPATSAQDPQRLRPGACARPHAVAGETPGAA